jgi:hypothetical protein
MNTPWPYFDTVHGKPEGPAPGALLLGLLALFVGEEVGADERGVVAAEGGFRAGRGGGEGGRYGGGGSIVGTVPAPVPVPPGSGPQQPQQRLDEASDKVQHVVNSLKLRAMPPGRRERPRGSFVSQEQVDLHGHRCVAIRIQSEMGRARLARGSDVTTHLSHGS